mmetsp:Transcript_25385/g.55762  ORF Transcript_25385/g.55762 Transcript_25385/m.55762 type:complete len:394 (+) Transcript_25385:602-1783(+)
MYEDIPGAEVVEYTEAAPLPLLAAECERPGLRRTVRVLPPSVRPGRVRISSKETSREGGMRGILGGPGFFVWWVQANSAGQLRGAAARGSSGIRGTPRTPAVEDRPPAPGVSRPGEGAPAAVTIAVAASTSSSQEVCADDAGKTAPGASRGKRDGIPGPDSSLVSVPCVVLVPARLRPLPDGEGDENEEDERGFGFRVVGRGVQLLWGMARKESLAPLRTGGPRGPSLPPGAAGAPGLGGLRQPRRLPLWVSHRVLARFILRTDAALPAADTGARHRFGRASAKTRALSLTRTSPALVVPVLASSALPASRSVQALLFSSSSSLCSSFSSSLLVLVLLVVLVLLTTPLVVMPSRVGASSFPERLPVWGCDFDRTSRARMKRSICGACVQASSS